MTSSDVGIANSDIVPVKELVVRDSDGIEVGYRSEAEDKRNSFRRLE